MRFTLLALAGSVLLRTSPLTDLLGKAKKELAAKQVSCKRELERGDVQVEGARAAAAVASNLVTKAQADLTKVQVALENADRKLWAVQDARPDQKQTCAQDRQLKAEQHKLTKTDAEITAELMRKMECTALLECGGGVVLNAAVGLLPRLSANTTAALLQLGVDPNPPEPDTRASTKCAMAPVARCESVADGVAQLHALLKNRVTNLDRERADVEERCKTEEDTAVTQQLTVRNTRVDLMDRQQFYTKTYATAQKAAERKQEDYESMLKLVGGWRTSCEEVLADMQYKVDKLGRIRAGNEGLISDCEVSPWATGPCSAECGGGTRNLTRQIIAPPGPSGHECPVLERVEECNRQPCPVNCEMTPWAEWATCSRSCGGGTQSRDRGIAVPAKGGSPCGTTSETQLCNMDACDVDCVLSEWSMWGLCSQRCGGGAQKREKTVTAPTVGDGRCWEWDDDMRREFKPCPPLPCAPDSDPAQGLRMCDADFDLIVLLDASGSVDDAELAAEKHVAMGLLERVSAPAAVVAYAAGAVRVSEFGANFDGIAAAVAGLGRLPPAGSDFAQALGAASRLVEERAVETARPTTIVLFADGRDNAKSRANTASRELRAAGVRIVAVVAGEDGDVSEVASRPAYANVLSSPSFAEMDPVGIARVVCPA